MKTPIIFFLAFWVAVAFWGLTTKNQELQKERDDARQMFSGMCQAISIISDSSIIQTVRGESDAEISLKHVSDGNILPTLVWYNLSNDRQLAICIMKDGSLRLQKEDFSWIEVPYNPRFTKVFEK